MSKMAVRKKTKSERKKFSFTPIKVNHSIVRLLAVTLLLFSFAFVGFQGLKSVKHLWPVKKILLQGDIAYLDQSVIVNFVNQLPNKSMLAIDLEEIQNQTKNIDWVKNIEVRKVWPEQLVFTVEEHQPVARVNKYILTQQGTKIYQQDELEKFEGLPKIEIQHDELNEQSYASVWQEFKQVKRQFELLSLELSSLSIDPVKNWHLQFNDGLILNLGRRDRMARVERLVKIFSTIENKNNIKLIDLRYHNGIAVEWFKDETKERLNG
ncbi:cell division protein FtsQ/DivIB [Aliikangiella sp. IMCC44359]|uniref:cell division protein FtsQ/DivIB n=1 Tax=Aliikangiella sp. IMCC44359 TaxID=3459125 RepID=UPI00403AF1B4